jgi:hypothetical protein
MTHEAENSRTDIFNRMWSESCLKRVKAKKTQRNVVIVMMMLLIFAHFDERGHFYVMGCQLIRRRRQLGPIGPLHKFYLLCPHVF